MNIPEELAQLVEDLKNEGFESSVRIDRSSKAALNLDLPENSEIILSGDQCTMLLHSPDTVKQMCEILNSALNTSEDVTITLYSMDVEQDVLDYLERNFTAVDEM